ncbi:MAG: 4,5-DOPA dioxygenase extradiol [Actinomycetota bacterium]
MSVSRATFLGHGNPMNALEHNRFTEAWATLGASAPTPRAVLAISAHWYVNATAVTAMAAPRTIHDFFGFPKALFDVEYPAPGAPELAAEIVETVAPVWVGLDADSWGLDHGTWSVLAHVFPRADVPVVQLSIDATKPIGYHVDLGARLAPLLDTGVMIVASGNIVHNLGRIEWGAGERGADWAERFDTATTEPLQRAPAELERLREHPDYPLAVPTPDHFLPLAYVAGIAAARNLTPEVLVGGCTLGSLSMTSYLLDAVG